MSFSKPPFPYKWSRNIWMVPLWFLMEFLVKVLSQISQTTEILEYLCETTCVTSFLWVRKDLLHSGHLCWNFPVWSLPRVCKRMSCEESKFFFFHVQIWPIDLECRYLVKKRGFYSEKFNVHLLFDLNHKSNDKW